MPRVSPLQNDFSSGEISPRVQGRVESPHYKNGLASCQNWVPMLQGPASRRSGTAYVAATKGVASDTPILVSFKYSNTQSYILEFGSLYIRFFKNNAQILSSGSPYEVVTTFTTAELPNIRCCQSNDVLYLVHPSHPLQKLTRFSDTNWKLEAINLLDGPYLPPSVTAANFVSGPFINATVSDTRVAVGPEVTVKPAAATGTTTLTTGPATNISATANNGSGLIRVTVTSGVNAGAWTTNTLKNIWIGNVLGTTEANGVWAVTKIDSTHYDLIGSTFVHAWISGGDIAPAVFSLLDVQSGDQSRHIRMLEGSKWGWAQITDFTSPAQIGITVPVTYDNSGNVNTLTNTNAKRQWKLGLYNANHASAPNYPSQVAFYQGRLFLAGTALNPERLDGSQSDDFENFAPTEQDGTVTDADAVGFSLESNDANPIQWMSYNETGLVVGTSTSEWLVGPSNTANAFSATNIQAVQSTFYGSNSVQAVQAGKATIMVQTAGRQLRELSYFYYLNGFRGEDITLLSEHITGDGVTALAFQRVPTPMIWGIRADGQLLGCTYERTTNDVKVGWHEHQLGGYSYSPFVKPLIKRLAVIPSADGLREDVWMIVQRQVNGSTVQYLEYLTKQFDQNILQENAVCVDCSLSYDVPLTVTGISTASQPVVTSAAHGLSNGNTVIFRGLLGSNFSSWNYNIYTVTGVTTNTFKLTELTGLTLDATIPFQSSGATVRKRVTTISGLSHLNGESVYAWADGAVQGPFTVNASTHAITLTTPAATVTVGYVYNSDLQMLRLEGGAADGTALGKIRRINRMRMYFYRTLGIKFGPNFTSMDDIVFETTASGNGQGPALFSGIQQQFPEFDYDTENQICIRAATPAPATLLAVMSQVETQDAG